MKNFIFITAFLLSLAFNSNAQDKIHSIDLTKIDQISAELKTDDDILECSIIKEKDIDALVSILKSANFRESDRPVSKEDENSDEWKLRLVFKGQRDQMYFFNDFAFIGKSTYIFNAGVTDKLLKSIKDFCKKQ